VLDGASGQPLAGVVVYRGRQSHSAAEPQKGGEQLIQKPDVLTGASGRFELASERVLTLYRFGGWTSVRLGFEKSGYTLLRTNFSGDTLHLTNLPGGEPLAEIGEIQLWPAPRKGTAKP
jgi:hypothetical protein